MSRTIIYLGLLLPAASSDLPGNGQGTHSSLFVLLRMGFTQPLLLPEVRWSLTPPFHPYRPKPAVYFLLHWPGSHLHRTLSGILPYEARTFLTHAFAWPRSPVLLTPNVIIQKRDEKVNLGPLVSHSRLYFKTASPHEFPADGIVRETLTGQVQEIIQEL